MTRKAAWTLIPLVLWPLSGHSQNDTQAPTVVDTFPANGSENVDPDLSEISVSFSEAMRDRSWSWAYEHRDSFPRITANPSYDEARITNTLPVDLESNQRYEIWLNSEQYQGFQDQAGNPLHPYRWIFSTGNSRP